MILKKEQEISECIKKYFHLSIFTTVEQNMILKLREIIDNYQVNDKTNRELKSINDSIKKLFKININKNDFPNEQNKNNKFF